MSATLSPAKPSPRQTPVRSIILLAAAGFASQAQVRVTDSLLPQIASDFQTTVGVTAIVLTAYAVTHGSIQFVVGPMADRFGKYRTRGSRPAPLPAGSFRYRWLISAM